MNLVSKKRMILGVVAICSIAFLAAGCDSSTTTPPSLSKEAVVTTPSFDVPSLVGKNVDEIKTVLGPAANDTEPTKAQLAGAKEWDKTWKKDDNTLLVTYSTATRKVVDFFIESAKNDPDGLTRDKQGLLDIGNLKESDPHYKIEFVKSLKDPSGYTGVKVTPQ